MHVPVDCVPDPDIAGCGNVFVSVAADDCVARAVFDTGSPTTLLIDVPPSARPVGSLETSGMFGTEVVTQWKVRHLRVGSLSAGPLTVHRIAAGVGRHAVLGLDVLGTSPWQLDIAGGTLRTGVPPARGPTFQRGANGHILTEMRWPGATATAMWDTGAGITLIDRRFAEAHAHLFEDVGSTQGSDVVGSPGDFSLARISPYEIDETGFAAHLVAIADLSQIPDDIDAAIGFPTIQQARWTVDVQSCRWTIDR